MELTEMVTCPTCNGSGQTLQRGAARQGYDEPDYMDVCGICGGTGEVPASMFSDAEDDEPADNCEGQDDSEGDDPLPREGEHADDYNVRREEWMFGPQDGDLGETSPR